MTEKSTTDQILDLLLDALQERQAARETDDPVLTVAEPAVESTSMPLKTEPEDNGNAIKTEPSLEQPNAFIDHLDAQVIKTTTMADGLTPPHPEEPTAVATEPPARQPSIHLEQLLWRMLGGIALLIILINIPFNQHGTALARAMPDETALIIRDGLLLKGSGEKVYVLENNQRRWITTLEAFEYYGYRWENVHEVEDPFLQNFVEGQPIYILYKCSASPHIYAFEDGKKRWIKDPPTFEAEGFIWEEIAFISCTRLRNMPDGIPFPADAGDPPQP